MEITFLGTGTSHGVPMIGCECEVCTSTDPRNQRTRSSVYINTQDTRILIDTTPELRIQALREKIARVDGVLFTHAHADHLLGLDDVRRFNKLADRPMPCYGSAATLATIRRIFDYAFTGIMIGGGIPQLDLVEVSGPFECGCVVVTPIPVLHGRVNVLGYRIGSFAYVTDCNFIPPESKQVLQGLELLVLGVLRPTKHTTHFSLEQGLEVVQELAPKKALFTHISHRIDHGPISASLPPGVELAYDGLRVHVEEPAGTVDVQDA